MAKTIFEQLGGTYTMQGDYCLLDLTLPPQRKTSYRRVGATTEAVFATAP